MSIIKTTEATIVQEFDDKGILLSQRIVASEDMKYEIDGVVQDLDEVNEKFGHLPYAPFEMAPVKSPFVCIDFIHSSDLGYVNGQFSKLAFVQGVMSHFRNHDLGLLEAKQFVEKELIKVPRALSDDLEQIKGLRFRILPNED